MAQLWWESLGWSKKRTEQVQYYLFSVVLAWVLAGVMGEAMALVLIPGSVSPESGLKSQVSAKATGTLLDRRLGRADYQVILTRNIFDSLNRRPEVEISPNVEAAEVAPVEDYSSPPQPSSLPYKLLGTIVSSSPRYSVATLNIGGKKVEVYRTSERILDEYEITGIERNRVYFKNRGRIEYIEAQDAAPMTKNESPESKSTGEGVRETSNGNFVVDRTRVESVMENMSEVMTQARVVPYFEDGKSAGWKIFAIKPKSIYQELKLRNGDVIQRINGQEVDSPARALEMYQTLATQSRISLDIIRRGKKESFQYEIR